MTSFVLINPGIGEVVRRTRGRFLIESDQSALLEGQVGAIGFIVVNDLALAAGAASIPGPVTDASDDGWFVWEPFAQMSGVTGGGSALNPNAHVYEFDSKAMRKVADGFSIAVMIEIAAASGGVDMSIGTSLLGSRT